MGERAISRQYVTTIDHALKDALQSLLEYLHTCAPRTLFTNRVVHITLFADGACEPDPHCAWPKVTVGAVVVFDGQFKFWMASVPVGFIRRWSEDGKEQ